MSSPSSSKSHQTCFNLTEGIGLSSNPSTSSLAKSIQQAYEYLAKSFQEFFWDPQPQIISKASTEGPVVYQQRVLVRFLRPPPLPEPGPLIVKEVRPPQPTPPPPLVLRHYANPLPPLPPLVLREKPPIPPTSVPSQTVIRQLPAVPLPPRSVVIERFPSSPPKPRDIIIERWLPHPSSAKKRPTIVQKAPSPVPYRPPKNIIYIYDPPKIDIVRKVERLGIVRENPQNYSARYANTLLSPETLIQQARAAGVTEDLTPPQLFSTSKTVSPFLHDTISTSSLFKGRKPSIPLDVISTASSQGFLVSPSAVDQTDNSLLSSISRRKTKAS